MKERDEAVKADVFLLRTLSALDASTAENALVQLGLHPALISRKNKAETMNQIYEGIVELARHLGDSWDEAMRLTRESLKETAETVNEDAQAAYQQILRDTRHLYI